MEEKLEKYEYRRERRLEDVNTDVTEAWRLWIQMWQKLEDVDTDVREAWKM